MRRRGDAYPKASTTARGYGTQHQRERKRWAPVVARGDAYCTETLCLIERDGGSRWIEPGAAWDLAHTPDRLAYLGPAHSRCNRSEGAERGNGKATRGWVL